MHSTNDGVLAVHRDLATQAARRYLEHLRQVGATGGRARDVAVALIDSIEASLQKGAELAPEDVRFSKFLLGAMPPRERQRFVNEYALGLGRDDADVIVMGTEHAYDLSIPAEVVNFALECCASPLLWLSGGPSTIVEQIAGQGFWPPGPRRPHHIHPNDYYLVHLQAGRRTWPTLAEILGCDIQDLGDLAYQIELSAYPSRQSRHGRPPSIERTAFLVEVVAALRTTARSLLFHGGKDRRDLRPCRERLARAFLGLDEGMELRFEETNGVEVARHEERAVAIAPAFNNSGIRKDQYPQLQAIARGRRRTVTTRSAPLHPPLGHPVASVLPARTRQKLLSPVSEDKLSWDCFYQLRRLDLLARVVGSLCGERADGSSTATLVMWGYQIEPDTCALYAPLAEELLGLEGYGDGKPEGQRTEPDVIVIADDWLAVLECKRSSAPGACTRYEKQRCPEIHVETRKREYCQYWRRGLPQMVTYGRPSAGSHADVPICSSTYQLMRNALVGKRLGHRLGKRLHLCLVKSPASSKYPESEAVVAQFNDRVSPGQPTFRLVSWEALRAAAHTREAPLLEHYFECFG